MIRHNIIKLRKIVTLLAVIAIFTLIIIILNQNKLLEKGNDVVDESVKNAFQNIDYRDFPQMQNKEDVRYNRKNRINMEAVSDDDHTKKELREAKARIEHLEKKLAILEGRIPQKYPDVKYLGYKERKRILVTGGAGFVGSHLVDVLMTQGHEVIVVDNFFTGRKRNVEHWCGHRNFEIIHHDIVNPLYVEKTYEQSAPPGDYWRPLTSTHGNALPYFTHKLVKIERGRDFVYYCRAKRTADEIYHLASPASPPHYMQNPVKTIKTNTLGTINMLGLARRVGAKILIASTSEVYGDPMVHPQPETYWGHVNPIGPRACYDEGKRVAETLAYSYAKQENVSVRVARIFNTYGPRMHVSDGRVVSNFIMQALQNLTITVYGNGQQTRSFCYVSDLVDGLLALMESNYSLPVNIGNPVEHTIEEFALIIKNLVPGCRSTLSTGAAVEDDPQRRRPDISLAKKHLNWTPKVPLQEGLQRSIDYFREELSRTTFYNNQTYMDVKVKSSH